MKDEIYKVLSVSNDINAVYKGRIWQRIWNKLLMKLTRKFMK